MNSTNSQPPPHETVGLSRQSHWEDSRSQVARIGREGLGMRYYFHLELGNKSINCQCMSEESMILMCFFPVHCLAPRRIFYIHHWLGIRGI